MCLKATASADSRTATVLRLSAPSAGSTFRDPISFGGQTFNSSVDGKAVGQRHSITVQGEIRDNLECFRVELPTMSAVIFVIS